QLAQSQVPLLVGIPLRHNHYRAVSNRGKPTRMDVMVLTVRGRDRRTETQNAALEVIVAHRLIAEERGALLRHGSVPLLDRRHHLACRRTRVPRTHAIKAGLLQPIAPPIKWRQTAIR